MSYDLNDPEKRFVDYVDELATIEGGPTPDVLRTGTLPEDGTRMLLAEVINLNYENQAAAPMPLYCLTVQEQGSSVISITFNPDTNQLSSFVLERPVHMSWCDGPPGPVIDKFFQAFIPSE